MHKTTILLLFFLFFGFKINAQPNERPKLVVGIVVDQMRADYLFRYWQKFGNSGFKRLINKGFHCKNTHYNYMPTYTGPGHACVYTGATPALNGIVANDWFNRTLGKNTYCAEDSTVKTVGSPTINVGKMSPRNLISTTITDELKLATNMKSKIVGIALKDRGAILPAGHIADAAYWFDDKVGAWVTSSYYMQQLPEWVASYNKTNRPDDYLTTPWTTLLPLEQYTESIADSNKFETVLKTETAPVFPHNLPALAKQYGVTMIRQTPFGNNYTADFAKACVKNYGLGNDDITDFLCVSFSSTDIVGHAYAPQSIEVEDTYLRLDQTIADFLTYLDNNVGKNNYTLFLTADHGGVENTAYLKSLNMPTGLFDVKSLKSDLQKFLVTTYKDSLLAEEINLQIYLNDKKLKTNNLDKKQVCETVAEWLRNREGINAVYTREQLLNGISSDGIFGNIKRGFLAMRSGDIAYTLHPSWGDWGLQGTSHGMPYPYDTHVPLLWYGKNIKHGSTVTETHVTDIAATLAHLLNIQMPSGCLGKPILEIAR